MTPPAAPGRVIPEQEKTLTYATTGWFRIEWTPAVDEISGIREYELQERVDNYPVWKTIGYLPAGRTWAMIGSKDEKYLPANASRPLGHFYYYRVRARDYAGNWGSWSVPSTAQQVGPIEPVIDLAFSYPNPVDTRKPGEEGKAHITYRLGVGGPVTITIYDLFGYKVREWHFTANETFEGNSVSQMGYNLLKWDGTNEMGDKVSKGGYICQIIFESPAKGKIKAIIKIGVIH